MLPCGFWTSWPSRESSISPGLDYIASAGLRVFLITQKRVKGSGGGIKLINVNQQIYDIFRYAGFDRIIDIARARPSRPPPKPVGDGPYQPFARCTGTCGRRG